MAKTTNFVAFSPNPDQLLVLKLQSSYSPKLKFVSKKDFSCAKFLDLFILIEKNGQDNKLRCFFSKSGAIASIKSRKKVLSETEICFEKGFFLSEIFGLVHFNREKWPRQQTSLLFLQIRINC